MKPRRRRDVLSKAICDLSRGFKATLYAQSSRVLVVVPAGTSKSTSRRHGIQAVTRVMAYVADAVTL
jgi:hypothetical protein